MFANLPGEDLTASQADGVVELTLCSKMGDAKDAQTYKIDEHDVSVSRYKKKKPRMGDSGACIKEIIVDRKSLQETMHVGLIRKWWLRSGVI